jgi:hypothetical protein
MKYIKVDTGGWIEYDEEKKTARVLKKAELVAELEFNMQQLSSLPKPVTNTELLAWAKENYPSSGTEQSRILIQNKISDLTVKLEEMK